MVDFPPFAWSVRLYIKSWLVLIHCFLVTLWPYFLKVSSRTSVTFNTAKEPRLPFASFDWSRAFFSSVLLISSRRFPYPPLGEMPNEGFSNQTRDVFYNIHNISKTCQIKLEPKRHIIANYINSGYVLTVLILSSATLVNCINMLCRAALRLVALHIICQLCNNN